LLSAFGVGTVAARSGRFLLAFVFLLAGLSKSVRPGAFRTSVDALLPLAVPRWLTAFLAVLIPVIELGTGVSLMVTSGTWPLAVGAGLLIGFELVLVRAWRSGLTVSCNCFGSSSHYPVSGVDVLRTGLLLTLCLSLLLFGNGGAGIVAASAAVGATVLDNVTSQNNTYGIAAATGNNVVINRSVFSANSAAGIEGDPGAQIAVNNSTISHNNVGVESNSSVRLSNNDIAFNSLAISGASGTFGNNRFSGNGSIGTPPTPLGGATSDVGQQ